MIYTDINSLEGEYGLIMSDPPWMLRRGGKKAARPHSSGMPLDYPTQSLEEIKDYLQIATEHTTEDAVLFLWTTEKYLRQAEDIATELGYKIHNRMIYSKCGMGQAPAFTLRFSHEYLLYCYKGKFIPINKSCRGKYADVFEAKPRKHSQKPDIAYQIIEDLYPQLRKLEMYSRQARDGWDAFGNEVED